MKEDAMNLGIARDVVSRSKPRRALRVAGALTVNLLLASGIVVSTAGGASAAGSYANPLRSISGLVAERIDQGVDYTGTGKIYAVGDGVVKMIHNSGWPNGVFIAYTLSDGAAAGKTVYEAECITPTASLAIGQSVTSTTVLGTVTNCGSGIELGWADPNQLGVTLAQSSGQWLGDSDPLSTAYGVNFSQLLVSLGAKGGVLNKPVQGSVPLGWPSWGTSTPSGFAMALGNSAAGNPTVFAKATWTDSWMTENGHMQAIAATGTTQMILDTTGVVWARASGVGTGSWIRETSGITAIAAGPGGLQMVLDTTGHVWAKTSGVGIGGFVSEAGGIAAISAGGGDLQMVLDTAGDVFAKAASTITPGGFTQETGPGYRAISAGASGLLMFLDSGGGVSATTTVTGNFTSEGGNAQAISAGGNGLQMELSTSGVVSGQNTVGNNWIAETPAGEVAIAAGSAGLQMVLDSAGTAWGKSAVINYGGFTSGTGSTTSYQKIAAG
jgi:hypothetical protein